IYDLRGNVVGATPRGRSIEKYPHGDVPTSRRFIWTPDKSISSGIYFVSATMSGDTYITKRIMYLK
ncbi:MAG: hypothetical protein DRN33_05265, partial [Thermoplasmata archaeon]